MPSIAYYQVGERIVAALPELTDAFESCLEQWRPELPGAVNVADDVLTPALDRWLESDSDEDLLRRAFGVIEELAADPDLDIRDAVQVGVVNWIAQDPQWVSVAERFMGPKTREMLERSGLRSTEA
jgi:hypothetical protein